MSLSDQQYLSLAYITGAALGDGNLSNPNGRAVRLRITCDSTHLQVIDNIKKHLSIVLPNNKVSIVDRKGKCIDISCYSNKWENWLGWYVGHGSKHEQRVSVPQWIKKQRIYTKPCLKGLIETDGSVYRDRGYIMVNFVTITPCLAKDVMEMFKMLGFAPNLYSIEVAGNNRRDRYNIRLSRDVENFLNNVEISKRALSV